MRQKRIQRGENSISIKVRRLRQERRWTQIRLAKSLGLSQNRLSEIERGKGSFTAEQLLLILRNFNVSIDYFKSAIRAAHGVQIQNALARLGAAHLQENFEALPSERLREAADVIRETLVAAESPRYIAAIAPVFVIHRQNLNLNKLKGQLAEVGLERRLGWALENTQEALHQELNAGLTTEWKLKYQKAETAIQIFLAPWGAAFGFEQGFPDDVLDPDILTEKTVKQVYEEASEISRKWHIVTRITTDDFRQALISSRGNY